MKRKIIKQGNNTLTVTLPSEWTKKEDLKAGNEIEIFERDNGLFLSYEGKSDEKSIEFDITNMSIPIIWKYFMGVYREGYNKVIIRFSRNMKLENPYKFFSRNKLDLRYKKQMEKIRISEVLQEYVNRFIGFEIIEHGNDYIIVKDMGDLTLKEFDNSLKRIFSLIKQMTQETLEAIENNDPKLLEHMHDVDINLDKFHDYCIRILNKVRNKENKKTSLLFSLLYLLELVGDEFKNISFHIIEDYPKTNLKNIKKLVEYVKEQFDNFFELYYEYDLEKVKKISFIDEQTFLNISEIYKDTSKAEQEIFHHLRIIGRYINALVELRIEMEF